MRREGRMPGAARRRPESRRERPGDDGMAGFMGRRVGGHPFKLSFPLRGNGLNKPLDSGLRRNDEVPIVTPHRHSSESWNPGRRRRDVRRMLAFGRMTALEDGIACPCCHSRSAGMDCLNHWIPAFAGMTTGVEPGCSTDRSLRFPLPLFNIIIVHQYPVGLSLGVVELAGVDRPVERGREEGDETERDQDQQKDDLHLLRRSAGWRCGWR